ncbi:RNA-directed DNA polymerase, eukaryota [Tanacetum coccineum]
MVGNTSITRDSNGWYWKFKNNKNDTSILIQNPFQKEVEKIVSSFYVMNFPDYVDAKRLWKECESYGCIVDAFIAKKGSNIAKRFGYVRFLRVKNEEVARSLASIWIGSYHLFASVALFKRHETKEDVPKKVAKKMNGESKVETHEVKKKQLILSDQELVALVTISQFGDMKCLQNNTTLKSFFSLVKSVSKNFYVDERMVWVKISRLPLCAWGSNAYKKVASSVGKFMFFENDSSTAMSLGRVCVATRQKSLISEVVQVTIHGVEYDVQSDKEEELEFKGDKKEDKKEDEQEDKQEDKHNVEKENEMVKDQDESILSDIGHAVEEEEIPDIQMHNKEKSSTSDRSRPPGFEHYNNAKKEHSASSLQSKYCKCSTSFDKYRRKDIWGISVIHEMSKLVEVGEKLGYDVKGCHKSLHRLIDGIGLLMVDI